MANYLGVDVVFDNEMPGYSGPGAGRLQLRQQLRQPGIRGDQQRGLLLPGLQPRHSQQEGLHPDNQMSE